MADESKVLKILLQIKADIAGAQQTTEALKELQSKSQQASAALDKTTDPSHGTILSQILSEVVSRVGDISHGATEVAVGLEEAAQQAISLGGGLASIGTTGLLVGALALARALGEARAESAAIAAEIQKNTEALVAHIHKWSELAQQAKDFGDVVSVDRGQEEQLTRLEKRLDEVRNRQLGFWRSFSDLIETIGAPGAGTFEHLKSEEISGVEGALSRALAVANAFRDSAREAEEAWQKVKLEPLNQAIGSYRAQIGKLRSEEAAIGRPKTAAEFLNIIDLEAKIQAAIEHLNELTNAEAKLDAQTAKVQEQINQLNFEKLSSTTQLTALQNDLDAVQGRLRELGVEAETPNEALAKAPQLARDQEQEVIKLVGQWVDVSKAIDGVTAAIERANNELQNFIFQQRQAALDAAKLRGEDVGGPQHQLSVEEKVSALRKSNADALKEGKITEDEIVALAKQEVTNAEGLKAERQGTRDDHREIAELLREESTLLQDIRREQQLISQDPFLSADAKQALLLNLSLKEQIALQLEIARVKRDIKKIEAIGNPREQAEVAALTQKLHALQFEFDSLGKKIKTLSFGGGIKAGLADWVNSFGTSAHQISQVIEQSIGASLQGINQLLLDSAFRTGNWKQALLGVEEQIANTFLTWIEHEALQFIASQLHITTTATTQTGAHLAALPAATAHAAAENAGTWGAASIAGAIALVAAIGIMIAAMSGAFETGGYTGGRRRKPAGIVHGEEYVFTAEETESLGVPFLQRLASSSGGVAHFGDGGRARRLADASSGAYPGYNVSDPPAGDYSGHVGYGGGTSNRNYTSAGDGTFFVTDGSGNWIGHWNPAGGGHWMTGVNNPDPGYSSEPGVYDPGSNPDPGYSSEPGVYDPGSNPDPGYSSEGVYDPGGNNFPYGVNSEGVPYAGAAGANFPYGVNSEGVPYAGSVGNFPYGTNAEGVPYAGKSSYPYGTNKQGVPYAGNADTGGATGWDFQKGGLQSRMSGSWGSAMSSFLGGLALSAMGSGGSGYALGSITMKHLAGGMRLPGAPSKIDTIPAMLAEGEVVLPSDTVALLDSRLNRGWEKHLKDYVYEMPSPTLRMAAGGRASGGASANTSRSRRETRPIFNVAIFDDRRAAQKWLQSADGENFFVDLLNRTRPR